MLEAPLGSELVPSFGDNYREQLSEECVVVLFGGKVLMRWKVHSEVMISCRISVLFNGTL